MAQSSPLRVSSALSVGTCGTLVRNSLMGWWTQPQCGLLPGSDNLFLAEASPSTPSILIHHLPLCTRPIKSWKAHSSGRASTEAACWRCQQPGVLWQMPSSVCRWRLLSGFLAALPPPFSSLPHINSPALEGLKDATQRCEQTSYLSWRDTAFSGKGGPMVLSSRLWKGDYFSFSFMIWLTYNFSFSFEI